MASGAHSRRPGSVLRKVAAPLLALGALVIPCRGSASESPHLVVVEPTVDGEWPGMSETEIGASITQGLEGLDGFQLSSGGAASCTTPPCWAGVAQGESATHVLSTQVTVIDRDVELRLEVLDGSNGALVASGETSCEVCSDSEVREMVTAAAAQLRPRLEALLTLQSTIVVESRPADAEVIVDGESLGRTPFRGAVGPGPHEVVVVADGYHPAELRRFSEPGDTQLIELSLRPRDDRGRRPALGPMGKIGIAALAVGAATAGVSIGLLLIDDDPVQRSCPPGGPDINGRCPRAFDTRPGGIASAVVAGALVVTGAVLLATDRKRARRLAWGAGPGAVAISARF